MTLASWDGIGRLVEGMNVADHRALLVRQIGDGGIVGIEAGRAGIGVGRIARDQIVIAEAEQAQMAANRRCDTPANA